MKKKKGNALIFNENEDKFLDEGHKDLVYEERYSKLVNFLKKSEDERSHDECKEFSR